MRVVILGSGRVGSILAREMDRAGHDITVVDHNADSFRRLGRSFGGKTVLGNGLDQDVLERAGLRNADAFVAVTQGDNRNIMSVQVAKEIFGVKRAIARINDPSRAYAYNQLGIDTICVASIGAGLVRDYLLDRMPEALAAYCTLGLEGD
jgi:trk system potassium uptake protein TrkA